MASICPVKKLSELTVSISTGLNPRTNFKLNDVGAVNYYVTVKEIAKNRLIFSESTDKVNNEALEIIQKRSHLAKGDILFSGIGTIGKVVYVDIDTNNWNCSESVFIIKPNKLVDGKYLSFILKSNYVTSQYNACAAGAIMKGVRKQTLENLQIPLPSLSEQQRIVDILDKFEGMVENVEKELLLRQKQYEVYREKVIFSIPIIRKVCKLSEIAKIKNGKDYKHLSNGNIPVWGTGGIMTYVDTFAYDKPSVLLPRKGSIENIYYTEKPFWTVDTLFYTEIDEFVVVPKYFFYYMSIIDLSSYNTSVGNRPSLTKTVLDNIEIPLPHLDKQQEIVNKLDKFEELIENLKEELELRKKQYEYYREKLLTFE